MEALQFVVINKTQRKVRPDLADAFLKRLPDNQLNILGRILEYTKPDRYVLAIKIADRLVQTSGIFRENVASEDEPKRGRKISRSSFHRSIDYVLKSDLLAKLEDMEAAEDEIIEEFTEIITNWWEAWYSICKPAFEDPANYLIIRSVGIYTLHKLLRELINELLALDLPLSKETFRKILDRMDRGTTVTYWSTSGEAGKAGGGTEKASNVLLKSLLYSARQALFSLFKEQMMYNVGS